MKKVHHNHKIFYIKHLIKKDYIKLKKKYTKRNREIFYTEFLF